MITTVIKRIILLMNKYNVEKFIDGCTQLNISLSEKQLKQFLDYYELLVEWNSFMNLTAITEFEEVLTKHFIDSISLVKAVDLSKNISVIDVGTGAGFPGVPLKIVFPDLKVTLLDSLNKRVKFLKEVIHVLKLENIDAIHGRAEDAAKSVDLRENFDLCVSRAVANLSTLSEYCLPFVKIGGMFVSYKSEKIVEEIEDAKRAVFILGGEFFKQVEFTLPDSNIYRNLFMIKKKKVTPKKYPRKAGLPSKEPIK